MNAQTPEPIDSSPEFYTDLPVGEILRRTRAHYGQSLDDVGNFLRIRASQLEALEKGDVEKLPGRVYAIGYVRTYSEYLGLDGEKMVQLFKHQSLNRTTKPELHFPVPASESKAPNLFIIFGSLVVLVLVIGVWLAIASGEKPAEVADIPNVPEDMRVAAKEVSLTTSTQVPADLTESVTPALTAQVPQPVAVVNDAVEETTVAAAVPAAPVDTALAPAPAPATTEVVAEAAAPAPEVKREIIINVKERSWVEVRDQNGKPILSRILKPGEIFIVPEQNYGLRLDTGNAGGLEMLVNGQQLPPLGKQGDILRGFVLDGNQLIQRLEPAGGVNQ